MINNCEQGWIWVESNSEQRSTPTWLEFVMLNLSLSLFTISLKKTIVNRMNIIINRTNGVIDRVNNVVAMLEGQTNWTRVKVKLEFDSAQLEFMSNCEMLGILLDVFDK